MLRFYYRLQLQKVRDEGGNWDMLEEVMREEEK